MASTASRGYITSYEAIKKIVPDILMLRPFGVVTYAHNIMTKEKRASKNTQARKKKVTFDTSKTSEVGIMVGFHTIHSTTYKVLLQSKEVIHCRSCLFDNESPYGMPSDTITSHRNELLQKLARNNTSFDKHFISATHDLLSGASSELPWSYKWTTLQLKPL